MADQATIRINAEIQQALGQVTALRQAYLNFTTTFASATKDLQRQLNSFSGDKIKRDALGFVQVVQQLGGVTRLTASEQRSLNATLGEALQKYQALGQQAPAAIRKLYDETRQSVGGSQKIFNDFFLSIAGGVTVGNLLATGIKSAISSIVNVVETATKAIAQGFLYLGQRGSEVRNIELAFRSLAGAAGESADAIVAQMSKAAKGLISNFDLMQSANRAMLLGLPATAQNMATLTEASIVLGRAMGLGPTRALEDLTIALGRSSPRILDNLGIIVKVKDANIAYAASIGKSVQELTAEQRTLAFSEAAFVKIRQRLEELGEVQLTFADKLNLISVGWTNLTDAMGVAISLSPVMNVALDTIAEELLKAFGANQVEVVQRFISIVNSLAIKFFEAAQVIIPILGEILFALSSLFMLKGVDVGYTLTILGKIGLALSTILAVGAAINKNSALGAAAVGWAAEFATLQRFAAGLVDVSVKQNVVVAEFVLNLEKLDPKLAILVERMRAAQGQAVTAQQVVQAFNRTLNETAEGADLSGKEIESFEKKLAKFERTVAAAADRQGIDELVERFGAAASKIVDQADDLEKQVSPTMRKIAEAWREAELAKKVAQEFKKLDDEFEKSFDANLKATVKFVDDVVDLLVEGAEKMAKADKTNADARKKTAEEANEAISKFLGSGIDARLAQIKEEGRQQQAALDEQGKLFFETYQDIADTTRLKLAEAVLSHIRHEQGIKDSSGKVVISIEQMQAMFRAYAAAVALLAPQVAAMLLGIADSLTKQDDETKKADTGAELFAKTLDKLGSAFQDLSQEEGDFADQVGDLVRLLGAATRAGDLMAKAMKQIGSKDNKKALEGIGNAIVAIVSAVATLESATRGANRTRATASGAMAGWQIGNSIVPGWGGVVGAGIGALVGWIRSNAKQYDDIMRDLGREWGISIGEELAKEIEKAMKKIRGGTQAQRRETATAQNLPDVIREGGGVTNETVGRMTGLMQNMLRLVEEGRLRVSEARAILDSTFSLFAEQMIKTGGVATEEFRKIIEEARRLGVVSEEINKFLQTQAARAAAAFGAMLKPNVAEMDKINERLDEAKEKQKEASDEVLKRNRDLEELMSEEPPERPLPPAKPGIGKGSAGDYSRDLLEYNERIKEYEKQIKARQDAINEAQRLLDEAVKRANEAAGDVGKVQDDRDVAAKEALADATRVAALLAQTFAAGQREGLSLLQILESMGPAMDDLIALEEEYGFQIDNAAINQLRRFRQFTTDFPELAGAINLMNEGLIALSMLGGNTAEGLGTMAEQMMNMFDEALAAGADQNTILAMMLPFLQNARAEYEKMGVPMDENTRRLLEMAEAAGLNTEKTKTQAEAMQESTDTMREGLAAIIEALGGTLPEAWRAAAAAAKEEADKMKEAGDGPTEGMGDFEEAAGDATETAESGFYEARQAADDLTRYIRDPARGALDDLRETGSTTTDALIEGFEVLEQRIRTARDTLYSIDWEQVGEDAFNAFEQAREGVRRLIEGASPGLVHLPHYLDQARDHGFQFSLTVIRGMQQAQRETKKLTEALKEAGETGVTEEERVYSLMWRRRNLMELLARTTDAGARARIQEELNQLNFGLRGFKGHESPEMEMFYRARGLSGRTETLRDLLIRTPGKQSLLDELRGLEAELADIFSRVSQEQYAEFLTGLSNFDDHAEGNGTESRESGPGGTGAASGKDECCMSAEELSAVIQNAIRAALPGGITGYNFEINSEYNGIDPASHRRYVEDQFLPTLEDILRGHNGGWANRLGRVIGNHS